MSLKLLKVWYKYFWVSYFFIKKYESLGIIVVLGFYNVYMVNYWIENVLIWGLFYNELKVILERILVSLFYELCR